MGWDEPGGLTVGIWVGFLWVVGGAGIGVVSCISSFALLDFLVALEGQRFYRHYASIGYPILSCCYGSGLTEAPSGFRGLVNVESTCRQVSMNGHCTTRGLGGWGVGGA